MTPPDHDPEGAETRTARREDAASPGRSDTWMMLAMIVCCATIPVALLITVIAGGVDVGAVSIWSWVLLGAAIAAASTMIARVSRGNR